MPKCVFGINDLQTVCPELAAEWHPTKNGDLKPSQVANASRKRVWWLGKCGHEWDAIVGSRKIGRGCPICAGTRVLSGFNDIETIAPELAKDWVPELNAGKMAYHVLAGSHSYAMWRCSKCMFEWKAEIRARVRGNGCPECAKKVVAEKVHQSRIVEGNTLAKKSSFLLYEWNYDKNKSISPEDITPLTNTKVWWICSKCKYEWRASVGNRVHGSGCPACAGSLVIKGNNDLFTKNNEVTKEWNYEKNAPLLPEDVHYSSGKKVWWICKYGHEWQAVVADRVNKKTGCPVCQKYYKTSFPEESIFYYVSVCFKDAVHSFKADFLGRKEIDIFIPSLNIGIEYDGKLYHKNVERDLLKDRICREEGIILIRVREFGCVFLERSHPTIHMKDNSLSELTIAIRKVMNLLGVDNIDIDVERDFETIYQQFRSVSIEESIANKYPQLCEEWSDKNKEIKPENIPATMSKKRYYWKCRECGYEWKTSLYERIHGSGCPVCSNKKLIVGINDLGTTHKELVKEWDTEKNGDFKPSDCSYGSQAYAWWKCEKCKHEWRTRVNRRVNGSGCPICARETRKAPILQLNSERKIVAEYTSLSEASEKVGMSKSSISQACKTGKIAGGFLWQKID